MFQTMFQVEQQKQNNMNDFYQLSRFLAVEIKPVHYGIYYGPREDWPQKETNGEQFIHPKSIREYPMVFERNYQEHLKTEPDTTPQDYQQYAIEYLSYLMGKIESHYERSPKKIGNHEKTWVWKLAKRFNNEYLKNGLGFDSVLTPAQLKYIYPDMKEYCATSPKNFIAALTPRPLPPGFERVRWIHKNQKGKKAGEPNQYSLRAFLEVVTGGKTIRKADVSRCFTQPDGQPIELGKPKKDAYYQRYIKRFGKLM